MLKKTLILLALLAAIGVCTGVYMWNKPHKKAEDATGIAIDARALAKEYAADEKAADAKYLNRVIEVNGTIADVEKNQEGGIMAILATDDAATGVQCAMREKGANVNKGGTVVLKGFCSGNGITGVSLTDCIIK